MKKILLVTMVLVFLLPVMLFAQENGKILLTQKLPEGVILKDGKLKVKAGYRFSISDDGKTASVLKTKNTGAAGTFSCGCGGTSTSGACAVTILNGGLTCHGNCGCVLTTIISGIKYTVDFTQGVLRKAG